MRKMFWTKCGRTLPNALPEEGQDTVDAAAIALNVVRRALPNKSPAIASASRVVHERTSAYGRRRSRAEPASEFGLLGQSSSLALAARALVLDLRRGLRGRHSCEPGLRF